MHERPRTNVDWPFNPRAIRPRKRALAYWFDRFSLAALSCAFVYALCIGCGYLLEQALK